VQTVVAIRRHLFAQVKADPRLRALTETSFARLARRYGVGASTEAHRPQGRRAVVLDRDLVADLLAGCPEATAEAG
jgi:hypothetical protein